MFCFTSSVSAQLLNHIRDANMPKMAWMNLQKGFDRKHHGPELQLRHGLSNVEEKEMSVPDYTVIKEICDSLASINMTIQEDEMV